MVFLKSREKEKEKASPNLQLCYKWAPSYAVNVVNNLLWFCSIFQNSFFTEYLWMAVSVKKKKIFLAKETFYFISSYNADIFIDSLEKMWQTGRRSKVSPKNTIRYGLSMGSTFTVKCVIFHVNRPIINFLKTQ